MLLLPRAEQQPRPGSSPRPPPGGVPLQKKPLLGVSIGLGLSLLEAKLGRDGGGRWEGRG